MKDRNYYLCVKKNLIKEILNESRFSDKDRVLVREFISGRNFANVEEARARHKEVTEIINRNISALDFKLQSYKMPPRPKSEVQHEERINTLLETLQNQTADQ